MLTIKLYQFSKHRNSTEQPTVSTPTKDVSGLMKTPSSIVSPVMTVKENPTGYNYCFISDLSRYYFISDITYVLGEWQLSLNVDTLASFKTAIGNTSAYVLRAASTKNGYIKDNLYSISGRHTTSVQTWSPFPISSTGYFYLTVASKSASQYALKMNQANFDTLVHDLLGYGSDASLWQTVEQSLMNQTFNPIQYITNVYWSPLSFSTNAGGAGLQVGDYPTNAAYSYIMDKYAVYSHSFTITDHPQAATVGTYVNMAPYSEYIISAGGFGNINVPADLMTEASNTVDLNICVDTRNGSATLVAMCNGVRFARLTGSVGVQVPISQVSRDLLGGATSIASGLLSLAAGNPLGAANVLGGIQGIAGSNVSTTGALGSLANLYDNFRLTTVNYYLSGVDNTNNGSPLCNHVAINTLSGYLECEKGTFKNASALESEMNEINGYFTNGFYYE